MKQTLYWGENKLRFFGRATSITDEPRTRGEQTIYFLGSPASLLSNALTRYISDIRVRVQRMLLSEAPFCPGAERATPRVKMEKPRAYIAVH